MVGFMLKRMSLAENLVISSIPWWPWLASIRHNNFIIVGNYFGSKKRAGHGLCINMIKLTGREVTPELEQVIRGTVEAGVCVMKLEE